MMTSRCCILLLLFALCSPQALADVDGFTINSISGVGDLDGLLDERLEDEYRINFEECLGYLEADDSVTPRILIKWSLSSAYAGYDYAVKVGSCSDTDSISEEETDSCLYAVTRTDLDSYTNNELYLELPDLLGDECEEGDEGQASLYFVLQYSDLTDTRVLEIVEFEWDYEAPAPVTEVEVTQGETNLKVSWEDESNSGDILYDVYWHTAMFTEADLDVIPGKLNRTSESYTITGLENGVEYAIGVVAVDEFDNESELSELVIAMPVEVDDFWEQYKEAGGVDDGGYCFVATAAWGSAMAPKVMLLRGFRDRVLLTSAFGRALVDFYYVNGPAVADFIRHRPVLRGVTRVVLWPLVGVAWLSLRLGPMAALLILLSAMGGLFVVARRRFTR